MAESTAFPKPREADDAGYQQLSGFAIAGLVVGIVFVGFVLLQIVMGMLSHSAVLMPMWLEFIAVLGAGPMGLAVAYQLALDGHQPVVFEADDRVGGMAAAFDFSGLSIERYYHFHCTSDRSFLQILDELGLADNGFGFAVFDARLAGSLADAVATALLAVRAAAIMADAAELTPPTPMPAWVALPRLAGRLRSVARLAACGWPPAATRP